MLFVVEPQDYRQIEILDKNSESIVNNYFHDSLANAAVTGSGSDVWYVATAQKYKRTMKISDAISNRMQYEKSVPGFRLLKMSDVAKIKEFVARKYAESGTNDTSRQTTKKYTTRNSPPYKATSFCGERKVGNDGRMYNSKPNKNGVCAWRLHSSAKKVVAKKPAKKVVAKKPAKKVVARRVVAISDTSRQTTKKYTTRASPPYKAAAFCGRRKKGNSGRMYVSNPNKNGVCSWRLC
jgi:hypothetical protein